jgi:peptidoglycan/LPS O-acetylase OafA/YrhL
MVRPKHLPSLDGIRGIAVLMVVALHLGGGAQSSNLALRSIGLLIKGGSNGVTLFFILSGFLITGILWDDRESPHWWLSFYIRRSLRIFPLYYGTIFVVFLTAVFAHQAIFCLSRLWIYALFLQDIPALTHKASDFGSPLWLGHFWSLAVEEQFYLIWPFLLIRMKSTRQAQHLCIAVFILSALFRAAVWCFATHPLAYNTFLFSRAGELAGGGYLAICYRDHQWARLQSNARLFTLLALAGFLAVCVITRSFGEQSGLAMNVGLPCATVLGSGILVLSLQDGLVSSFTRLPLLRWFGDISYGLYVIHQLLNSKFSSYAATLAPHAGPDALHALKLFLGVSISITLAWISRRFFEAPFLKLRTRYKPESVVA